jgi:hypothetical protein
MNRGRLLSVQQGNFIGSIAPYGYDKDTVMDGKRKCPTLKINEQEANIVRMIFDMYVNEDMGRQKIANRLDSLGVKPPKGQYWSPPAIKDMLENVHYIGKVKWNWRKTVTIVEEGEVLKTRPKSKIDEYLIYDGKHPAIITEELFMQAREKQGRNHRAKPTTKVRNPLAGVLYCQCGRAMSYRTYKAKDGQERSAARLLCDNQQNCGTASCLYDDMLVLVKGVLKECIEDFEVRINGGNKNAAKLHANLIKDLEKKLEALDEKELGLWDKYSEEGMPKHIFEKLNEKVLKERDEIKSALCKAKESMPEPIDYEEKLNRFKDALEALNNDEKTPQEKNTLLKGCIGKIIYTREKPQRLKRKPDEKKGTTLAVGGGWTNPPIDIDVKLKV